MIIKSNLKSYKVYMEESFQFIERLGKENNAEFVIDKNVYEIYKDMFAGFPQENICIVEATEENKVIDTALSICEKMTELPAKRNAMIVSFGGGIIQDITGFVANILYRGIKWIFVPTTLLAACDSCIGGKTSLNYKKYKNLLGTFYPPDEIYICPAFFKTLSEKDYYSGLGEVIKFNLMDGEKGYLNLHDNIEQLIKREDNIVSNFVLNSLEFKKVFIEIDEFDKGERIKLNFAHTFGHAIEVVSKYKIPHGTAVAIGMIIANYISVERGILRVEIAERSERILLKVIDIDICLMEVETERFINAMRKDKKQTDNNLKAVLMYDKCELDTGLQVVNDIKVDEVSNAIEYFIQIYKNKRTEE